MKKILITTFAVIIVAVACLLLFFNSDSTNPYVQTNWGKFVGACPSGELPDENFGETYKTCDRTVPTEEIPLFYPVDLPFTNTFDNKKSLPLMASAMIDIDDDGVDELFLGGGVNQEDQLFEYNGKDFVTSSLELPKKSPQTTNYGAVSFDLDADGKNDLLVAGDTGVFWYRQTESGFESINLNVPMNDKSVPVGITLGDIDKDGDADMFVSGYIKLDKMEGQTIFKDFNYGGSSLLMINNGDNTFTDMTTQYGLSYVHNTFMGVLVDFDTDGYLDLVVAHDTGEVRTYKNNGGKTYNLVSNPTTGKYAYPMGIAIGDYNNDQHIDFFFSNTGSSVPEFLARGDLEKGDEFIGEWMLFENDGNFGFKNVADEVKVADFEFSWGALFEDFNLDGRQDLVVAENYVDFPPHKLFKLPCRFLIQRPNDEFSAIEEQAGVVNKNFGITPLTSDFNQDGFPDLIYINLNGAQKAFLSRGTDANYLAVSLPETAKYAGAKIQLTKLDGSILTDTYILGEGLSGDQTSTITFGLGTDTEVSSLEIKLVDDSVIKIDNPNVNAIIKV